MSKIPEGILVAGFTVDQASVLTGVSQRQLRYWDRKESFAPSIELPVQDAPTLRLYSFRDLVCLNIVSALRNSSKVSLQHLREVKDRLAHLGDNMWAKTTLYVLGKRVVFDNHETGEKEEAVSGQRVLQIPLKVVSGDMEDAVRAMRRRPAVEYGEIDIKRAGRKNPMIAGTRISVASDPRSGGRRLDQF